MTFHRDSRVSTNLTNLTPEFEILSKGKFSLHCLSSGYSICRLLSVFAFKSFFGSSSFLFSESSSPSNFWSKPTTVLIALTDSSSTLAFISWPCASCLEDAHLDHPPLSGLNQQQF
ncbi:hypothetical protein CISIN_1g033600mg [Citrus sinensis]|uniref:Uncharacterized protein n=1 Tax=Citrus sinensis TaxID=2711 RepID=A0A067EDC3_CITSI|nr:hypothetical protein CISIN_1g033600mg [Citrus sinensis]